MVLPTYEVGTWELVDQYNTCYPEHPLDTLKLRLDLTEEILVRCLNEAMMNSRAIHPCDGRVYHQQLP